MCKQSCLGIAFLIFLAICFLTTNYVRAYYQEKERSTRAFQTHLTTFQTAIEKGDKEMLKVMMEMNGESDEVLDQLIKAHLGIKAMVKDVECIHHGFSEFTTGEINYSRGTGAEVMLDLVIKKVDNSPSGYRFEAVFEHSNDTGKVQRGCTKGFLKCYLDQIESLPGFVPEG